MPPDDALADNALRHSWRVRLGLSASKPSAVRCSPFAIARTIRAKVRNSCCFELSSGSASKNGMTLVSRSSRLRTTNTKVVSRLALWFSRIRPQPRRSWMRSRTSLRSAFWLTWNSGTSCQPALVLVVPTDGYVERAFSVDIARNVGIQPFLLIVRTGWIFTAHRHTQSEGCDNERVPPDTRSFQHIAEFIDSAVNPLSRDVLNPARVPL